MGSRVAEYDHAKQAGMVIDIPIVWEAVKLYSNISC
jgi:hypothetical protein